MLALTKLLEKVEIMKIFTHKNLYLQLAIGSAIVLATGGAQAALLVNSFNSTVTVDFDNTLAGVNNGTFAGAGFTNGATSAGQLDSDAWRVSGLSDGSVAFGGSGTTGDFARGTSTGGESTGGIYAFNLGTDAALGVQPAGSDFTAGEFVLRIQNNTGSQVDLWDLSYDLWVNNDQGRGNTFDWAYSTDDATYTPIATYTSPEVADALGFTNVASPSTSSLAVSVADGDFLYLQWLGDDAVGGGSRDEFAIDNIAVTAVNAIPEPSSALGLLAIAGFFGLVARRRRPATV